VKSSQNLPEFSDQGQHGEGTADLGGGLVVRLELDTYQPLGASADDAVLLIKNDAAAKDECSAGRISRQIENKLG
jgi:hypothetical protein